MSRQAAEKSGCVPLNDWLRRDSLGSIDRGPNIAARRLDILTIYARSQFTGRRRFRPGNRKTAAEYEKKYDAYL